MTSDNQLRKLQEVLEPELLQVLPNSIFVQGDHHYLAFGYYDIRRDQHRWTVDRPRRDPKYFSTARIALSWCIAEKNNQHHVSGEIARLDAERVLLTADIETRQHLHARMSNPDLREAVTAKIASRRQRLQWVQTSLDKWISAAKYWQIRGFNNETSRTGRTPSHRTNR
jgi:hypothetical protein